MNITRCRSDPRNAVCVREDFRRSPGKKAKAWRFTRCGGGGAGERYNRLECIEQTRPRVPVESNRTRRTDLSRDTLVKPSSSRFGLAIGHWRVKRFRRKLNVISRVTAIMRIIDAQFWCRRNDFETPAANIRAESLPKKSKASEKLFIIFMYEFREIYEMPLLCGKSAYACANNVRLRHFFFFLILSRSSGRTR